MRKSKSHATGKFEQLYFIVGYYHALSCTKEIMNARLSRPVRAIRLTMCTSLHLLKCRITCSLFVFVLVESVLHLYL